MIINVEVSGEEIENETAKLFGPDTSTNWAPMPEYNVVYLKAQQQFFNDMLYARGLVLLNDVYDALGFPRTLLGAVLGWTNEGHIDFGIDLSSTESGIPLSFNPSYTLIDLFK